jgi:general secretion pathway protein G
MLAGVVIHLSRWFFNLSVIPTTFNSDMNSKQQRGFTLIEVMIVVVILGILASIVVPKIMGRPDEARATRTLQDIRAIGAALDLYRLDNFNYPSTEQGLEALVKKPANLPAGARWKQGGYLDQLPADAWGKPYLYLKPGLHGEYDLYSFGADGVEGGEEANADIGNWAVK